MYSDYVSSINPTLDVIGFQILDPVVNDRVTAISPRFQVGEMFIKADLNYFGAPDYILPGIFDLGPRPHLFMPKPLKDAAHILSITGVPKNGAQDFKIPGALYTSYWEDSKYGYLFQVIDVQQYKSKLSC